MNPMESTMATHRVAVVCGTCGVEFTKRRDHLKPVNYCSRECTAASRRVDGAKWRDPEQIREYMRSYVQRNRDRHNQRGREWARANRDKRNENQQRRRAQYQGDPDGVLRNQMLAVHGDRCLACGTAERIEVDHVVPVVRGGTHELANVQPLCRSCNAAKGARATDYRVKALYGIDIEEVAA